MDLHLTGRVALVTGGSKGIGRSIALTLAREGADVAICARGEAALEKTAQEISSTTGRRCLPVQADLSVAEDCARFVQTAVDHFGRADILVCCADRLGVTGGTLFTIPDEEWVYQMNLKVFSVVRCARAVVPHMQKSRWGRIVIIGGMATRLVRLRNMELGPVCAALANFGKQLAAQVIGDGIRVNVVHPDMTQTAMLATLLAQHAQARRVCLAEMEQETAAKLPLGRLLEPEEIAPVVAFLCSDVAGAITGQSLAVDGGAAMSVHY